MGGGLTIAALAEPSLAAAQPLALIPALPLLAFVVLILVGRRLGKAAAWLSVAALAASCSLTLGLAPDVLAGERLILRWPFFSTAQHGWFFGLSLDGLSWLMCLVVTSIGTLIQCYAIGYMSGDPRYSRFFAYLSLFCAAMLGLVLADHFVLLYGCWELVGLCSYLLISFWFEKPQAAAAGRKAFLTTRIGDAGLLLGILLLAFVGGDLRFSRLAVMAATLNPETLTAVSLLIFLGAAGKSAQIPLHVWLPDAMEGPTPVSALIHAATMVAAGVYLVARTLPLFTPESLALVLVVGLATHLLAGTVALTQTDIKRVLAYSTISQLGLMFTALGLGAVAVGMFHLVTHACFKALLFLGAGSVIHASHRQELEGLGGLWRAMPWTAAVFLIATLSACGFVPLSGFWSKDAILLEARGAAAWVSAGLLVGAAVTSAYMIRLYLRCFHGAPSRVQGGHEPHARPGPHDGRVGESPWIMVAPMAGLAAGSALVGLLGSPWLGNPFYGLFQAHGHAHLDLEVLGTSTLIAAVGAALGWAVGFRRRRLLPRALRPLTQPLYRLADGKYFADELYGWLVVRPFLGATRLLARADVSVIDGAVNGAGWCGWQLGRAKEWFDRRIVDDTLNGLASLVRAGGASLRWVQSGVVLVSEESTSNNSS